MNTDNTVKQHASLFDLDGVPKMSQAIPLALQHVGAYEKISVNKILL